MKKQQALRPIDLARAVGLSVQMVRNYEAWGFLPTADRSAKGYRLYQAHRLLSLAEQPCFLFGMARVAQGGRSDATARVEGGVKRILKLARELWKRHAPVAFERPRLELLEVHAQQRVAALERRVEEGKGLVFLQGDQPQRQLGHLDRQWVLVDAVQTAVSNDTPRQRQPLVGIDGPGIGCPCAVRQRPDQAMQQSPALLHQRTARIAQLAPALLVVVTGYFNCNPRSPAYNRFIAAGCIDTYLAAGNIDSAASTFHSFVGEQYNALEWGGSDPFWRVDWILVRGGQQPIQIRSCTIIRDVEAPIYPSDHYPVVADILLNQ